jgi:hypothetical protein
MKLPENFSAETELGSIDTSMSMSRKDSQKPIVSMAAPMALARVSMMPMAPPNSGPSV